MKDPRIVSIRHEKNRVFGAAIITGYKLALKDNMDIVAVMAGDNQMDPEHFRSYYADNRRQSRLYQREQVDQ